MGFRDWVMKLPSFFQGVSPKTGAKTLGRRPTKKTRAYRPCFVFLFSCGLDLSSGYGFSGVAIYGLRSYRFSGFAAAFPPFGLLPVPFQALSQAHPA